MKSTVPFRRQLTVSSRSSILVTIEARGSRIEDRATRRTFWGIEKTIIARKTIAKNKALDKRLFFKQTDSSQTFKYFHSTQDWSFSQALSQFWLHRIKHAFHLYLRLQNLILGHMNFELTCAGSFLQLQNDQPTYKNVNKNISTKLPSRYILIPFILLTMLQIILAKIENMWM